MPFFFQGQNLSLSLLTGKLATSDAFCLYKSLPLPQPESQCQRTLVYCGPYSPTPPPLSSKMIWHWGQKRYIEIGGLILILDSHPIIARLLQLVIYSKLRSLHVGSSLSKPERVKLFNCLSQRIRNSPNKNQFWNFVGFCRTGNSESKKKQFTV